MPETLKLELPLGDAIGEGTSGVVSPVLRSADGSRYAVKRLKGSAPMEALEREVRLLKLCSAECSDIVRYAFACESGAEHVLIFEACDIELWDALTGAWARAKAPASERLAWSLQICRAVSHCHHLGVLHRDVNPWNVLLIFQGLKPASARLGDFGLAVRLEGELRGYESPGAAPLDESAIGSLYSAPELGDVYGFPADVFSLGMTLLAIWASDELAEEQLIELTEGAKLASSHGSTADLGPLAEAPSGLRAALIEALHAQAAARPSADELRKHVEAAGSGNGGDGGGAQGGSSFEKVQAIFKKHASHLRNRLTQQDLAAILDSLAKPEEPKDNIINAAFGLLSNGKSCVDLDVFLKWVFAGETIAAA